MARKFHVSVEGAQHGPKGLDGFLVFANEAGAEGVQPSNFMLERPGGGFLAAAEIREKFERCDLKLDGISAHCPFWVHTTAWTQSPTIRPFIPAELHSAAPDKIRQWAEDYILRFLDLSAELNVRVVPMFWGTVFGWEVATGYPWGFWQGPGYDLIQAGFDRFESLTEPIREYANSLHIKLAHEIHPGTAAMCARDFLALLERCDHDPCLTVNADPSHCWEGESWEDRFSLVGDYVAGCHVKSHVIHPGQPLRQMSAKWPNRAMQFCQLGRGPIDLVGYAELMLKIGYAERYCAEHGTDTAPLVVEAEGAYADLDEISGSGIKYVAEHCCFDAAAGSFEEGMGAER